MVLLLIEVLYESVGVGLFDNFCFLLSCFDMNVLIQVDFVLFICDLFGDVVMKLFFLKLVVISEVGVL